MKNPHNDPELYFGGVTNRLAVYTGNVIADRPLAECTEAVLMTLDQNMRRGTSTNPKAQPPPVEFLPQSGADLDPLIQTLAKQKNGEKFRKLFFDGDISDYGSQSEADAALCAMIAFRAGSDRSAFLRIGAYAGEVGSGGLQRGHDPVGDRSMPGRVS